MYLNHKLQAKGAKGRYEKVESERASGGQSIQSRPQSSLRPMQEKPTNNEFLKLQYLEGMKLRSTTNANSTLKMRKNKTAAP
jgi:hypothetical protein